MVGDQCIVSLQPTIFQNIGMMLTELEDTEHVSAVRLDAQDAECNVLGSQSLSRVPKSIARGQQVRNRRGNTYKRSDRSGNTYNRSARPSMKMFCRLCYHAGAPQNTYLHGYIFYK